MPSFFGLQVHRDLRFGFSVLIPVDWQRLDVEASPQASFFAPDADDPLTGLAVEARDLGTEVSPDDVGALRRGFLRGLRALRGCRLESETAEAVGHLVTLEARHTFRDGDALRKRWVRLLYVGRTQVRLVAQGQTPEHFDYWEPMFYTAIRTFRFGSY